MFEHNTSTDKKGQDDKHGEAETEIPDIDTIPRKPRDILCLLLFLVAWIGWVIVALMAITDGCPGEFHYRVCVFLRVCFLFVCFQICKGNGPAACYSSMFFHCDRFRVYFRVYLCSASPFQKKKQAGKRTHA